jgi:hypothetical protein
MSAQRRVTGYTKHTTRCPHVPNLHDTATRGEIAVELAGRARVCKCSACLAQAQLIRPVPPRAGPPATSRDYIEQAQRVRLPALREVVKAKSARQERAEQQWLRDHPPSPTPPPRGPEPPLQTCGRPAVRSRHRLGVPLKPGATLAQRLLYAKSMAAAEARAHLGPPRDLKQAEQIFNQLRAESVVSDHEIAADKLAAAARRALGLPSPPPTPPPELPPPSPPFMDTLAAVPDEDWNGQWVAGPRSRKQIDYGRVRNVKWHKRHMPIVVRAAQAITNFPAWNAPPPVEPEPESEPEPEPEPEPVKKRKKRKIKTGWHKVDVSDLVRDRLMLRHVITSAVADGEVDRSEMRDIYKILARHRVPKRKMDEVKAALEDGQMDENDKQLLLSFVPPDPREDWKATVRLLEQERSFLNTVFRYYGSLGDGDIRAAAASSSSSAVADGDGEENIEMAAWRILCDTLRLPGPVATDAAAVEQLFIRAIQDRTPIGVDYFEFENLEDASYAPTVFQQAKSQAADSKGKGKGGRGKSLSRGHCQAARKVNEDMDLRGFIAAIVRLADTSFAHLPSLAESTQRFLEDHLRPYALALHVAEKDTLSIQLLSDVVQSMLAGAGAGHVRVRETVLKPLFMKYAATDDSSGGQKPKKGKKGNEDSSSRADREMPTMSQSEFMQLLTDGKLIDLLDKRLTGRECKALFVRVNLDDDLGTKTTTDQDGNLWVEEQESTAGVGIASSAVMEYDEFEEVVARIAYEKQGQQQQQQQQQQQTNDDDDDNNDKAHDGKKRSKSGKAQAALQNNDAMIINGDWSGTEQELAEMILSFVTQSLKPLLV